MNKLPDRSRQEVSLAAGRSRLAAAVGAGAWFLASGMAWAQTVPAPDPEADASQTSTEQGQSPLGESFETEDDRRDRIRAQRRKAFEDTAFDVQLRTYDLDRDKYDGSQSYAWAIGGSAGLKTGYFRDRFAIGLTGYTSQPIDAPDDKDGTLLLAPGQEGYAVIGEAYVQVRLTDGVFINAGRKAFDTPYLNRNDARMTPNTFEAIALQGIAGEKDTGEWRYGVGYFDAIKERNSEDFVSMAKDAGAERRSWRLCRRHELQEGRAFHRRDRLLQRRHHQHPVRGSALRVPARGETRIPGGRAIQRPAGRR